MATRVQNVDRLKRKLARMPDAVKVEVRKALELGAQEVVDMAKRLVPIDQGELQDSIGWTWGDAPKGSIALGTVGNKADLRITIYAGSEKAFYARWVEFGVSASGRGQRITNRSGRARVSGGATGRRPRPFFFPAYRASRKRIKSRVTRAVRAGAKKVASGG